MQHESGPPENRHPAVDFGPGSTIDRCICNLGLHRPRAPTRSCERKPVHIMNIQNITVSDLLPHVHLKSAFASMYGSRTELGRITLQHVLDYVQRGRQVAGVPEMDTAQECAQVIFSMFRPDLDLTEEVDALSDAHPIRVVLAAVGARIEALSSEPVTDSEMGGPS